MQIPINDELIEICDEIASKGLTNSQWAEIESCDMFQSESFCGGFDADENAFCFSYFTLVEQEFFFQFDLDLVKEILSGNRIELIGTPAD